MVFWELKPHFSYLLAQKNDLMFSTGTCLLQVLCSFMAVKAENPKPNGSGIWLDLMGREQGYSWLSISETEMICCAEPSGTPCFISIFCTVMGNWLQLQCFASQEHVCSGEMLWDRAGFLGWYKQADVPFEQQGNQLLSWSYRTSKRDWGVHFFCPWAASTAHHWLLQGAMGDQTPACWTVQGLLPFSLHWADFVSQGAQEAMAPPVGMALLPLQLPAVDELWPGKAELWFPALPRASPAHPGDRDGDRALLCSCTPCPTAAMARGTAMTP